MPSREHLLEQLQEYSERFAEESATVAALSDFVTKSPDCYERSNLQGHLTASAWIIDRNRSKVVLLHHFKLDRWMQPGGHADGERDLIRVACKEAEEETGIREPTLCTGDIFDIDIHRIPQRGEVPEHLHYDVRYLFEVAGDTPLIHNHESHDVRWVDLDGLSAFTDEESVLRMGRKTSAVDKGGS